MFFGTDYEYTSSYNSILTQFRKLCSKTKIKTKKELLTLGSPISELCRNELLDEKSKELEKISDIEMAPEHEIQKKWTANF